MHARRRLASARTRARDRLGYIDPESLISIVHAYVMISRSIDSDSASGRTGPSRDVKICQWAHGHGHGKRTR